MHVKLAGLVLVHLHVNMQIVDVNYLACFSLADR